MTSSEFTPSDIARFWSHVDIKDDLLSCWLWKASCTHNGYGQFGLTINGKKRKIGSHQAAWLLTFGDIPPETPCVLHDCPFGDERKCCNPHHFFLGTRGDNCTDAARKGRIAKGSKHGHSKLTESEIPIIRAMLAEGKTLEIIGRRFNVTGSLISCIKRDLIWTHVRKERHIGGSDFRA